MGLGAMLGVIVLAGVASLPPAAQTGAAAVRPAGNDPLAGLTAEERGRFLEASKAFNAQHFAEALPSLKALAAAHPENGLLAKYASEAAIDVGEREFAASTLKPIEAAHPEDWQAAALMARVDAEAGDKTGRDREIEHLADLQRQGVTPAKMTQYIVEKVHLADGHMLLMYNSLVPWGNYKVYHYGRVVDAEGRPVFRITLESSDFDQPQFAKEHPAEAAAGARRFSLDGYRMETGQGGAPATDTHFTFGFVDKRPTYDEVRADFIAIAEGKKRPMSSRAGLPIPK